MMMMMMINDSHFIEMVMMMMTMIMMILSFRPLSRLGSSELSHTDRSEFAVIIITFV
jgi:hypothetical protein